MKNHGEKSATDVIEHEFSTTRLLAIVGLPGAGKTQIGRYFLKAMDKQGHFVYEINAVSQESILVSYKQIFRQINDISIENFERYAFSPVYIISDVHDFFHKLSQTTKVFLFFDGLTSIDDGKYEALQMLPLNIDNVYILIASVNRNIYSRNIDVYGFTDDEAKIYLSELNLTDKDAESLFALFGGLPLGLTCAKEYLKNNQGTSVAEYISALEDEETRDLVEDEEDSLIAAHYDKEKGYRSQLAACRLLISQLVGRPMEILKFCSFLASNTAIPVELIQKLLSIEKIAFNAAIKHLTTKSLMISTSEGLYIHTVVQKAMLTYGSFSSSEKASYLSKLVIDSDALGNSEAEKLQSNFLYHFGMHFINMLKFNPIDIMIKAKLLRHIANYYGRLNDYIRKKDYLERLKSLVENHTDIRSQRTLAHTLTDLADACRGTGDYQDGKIYVMSALSLKQQLYPGKPELCGTNYLFLARLIIETAIDEPTVPLDEAEQALLKYMDIYHASPYKIGIANIEMGRVALLRGNIGQALICLKLAENKLKENRSAAYYGVCLRYLGQAVFYNEKDKPSANFSQAMTYLEESMACHRAYFGRETCVSIGLTICVIIELYKHQDDGEKLSGWIDKASSVFALELNQSHPDVKRFNKLICDVTTRNRMERR